MNIVEMKLFARHGLELCVISNNVIDCRALVCPSCQFMKPKRESRLRVTTSSSHCSSRMWRNSDPFSRLVASDSIGTGMRSLEDLGLKIRPRLLAFRLGRDTGSGREFYCKFWLTSGPVSAQS